MSEQVPEATQLEDEPNGVTRLPASSAGRCPSIGGGFIIKEDSGALIGTVNRPEYACKVCGQAIQNKEDLEEHERLHEEVEERLKSDSATGIT